MRYPYLTLKAMAIQELPSTPYRPQQAEALARGRCPRCSHSFPYLAWTAGLLHCGQCLLILELPHLWQSIFHSYLNYPVTD